MPKNINNLCHNCFEEMQTARAACPCCGYDNKPQIDKYPLALQQGSVLNGKYIVGKVLGQGGFGITYVSYDYAQNIKVAIKEFLPSMIATRHQTSSVVMSTSATYEEQFKYGAKCFLDEAKTLAKFNAHPSIVSVKSYFEENGTSYFVMEYIEGDSFKEVLKNKGNKVTYEEALAVILPVMDALSAVHKENILHRDVTPDNIYITRDGRVKLIDFGSSRYVSGEQSRSLDVILKAGYAPKEQYIRRGKQGPFTDVYSLGACFYASITGYLPPESLERMEEDELVPPSSRGIKLPIRAEDAILKALEVNAADRFQDIAEFKAELVRDLIKVPNVPSTQAAKKQIEFEEPKAQPQVQVQVQQQEQPKPQAQVLQQPQPQAQPQPQMPQQPQQQEAIENPWQANGQETESENLVNEKPIKEKPSIFKIVVFSVLALFMLGVFFMATYESDPILREVRAQINKPLGKITTKDFLSITELDLSDENITDISALSNLTNLTELSLWRNDITDISVLSNLTNLAILNLAANDITDISVLSNLTNLAILNLAANDIADLSALSNLTNLTVLGLSSNDITDISALSNLTNLTELFLWSNDITDISALSNLTNLIVLDLALNDITDISALSNLTNLTELILPFNNITDISALSNLTNLTELDFSNNIKTTDFSVLSQLNNLNTVYLHGYGENIDLSHVEHVENVILDEFTHDELMIIVDWA